MKIGLINESSTYCPVVVWHVWPASEKNEAALSSTYKDGDVMLPFSPEHWGGARDDSIDYYHI
jgi:hypothetical protein